MHCNERWVFRMLLGLLWLSVDKEDLLKNVGNQTVSGRY